MHVALAATCIWIALPNSSAAQDAANLSQFFSSLGGIAGTSNPGGNAAPAIGKRVADSLYADDPSAEEAIRAWYAQQEIQIPAASPGRSQEPPPPSADLLNLLGRALARPNTQNRSGILAAVQGCTLESVKATIHSVHNYWQSSYEHKKIPMIEVFEGAVRGISAYIPIYHALGQIIDDGGPGPRYWSARWQFLAGRAVVQHYAFLLLSTEAVRIADAERAARMPTFAHDYARFYIAAAAKRNALLPVLKKWIDALRDRGCDSHADYVRAAASAALAVGDELNEIQQLSSGYWEAFGLSEPTETSARWIQFTGNSQQLKGQPHWPSAKNAAAFMPERIDTILGPLPQQKSGNSTGQGASAKAPSNPEDLPNNGRRGNGGLQANRDTPGNSDVADGGRRPGTAAATVGNWKDGLPPLDKSMSQRVAQGGDVPGTWISVAGIGSWPQSELKGFWRLKGVISFAATLIRTSDDRRHFDGFVVKEGNIHNRWLDMNRDGQSNGWQGKVLVALLDPPGKCPYWANGGFLIKSGATSFGGGWVGQKRDPQTCEPGGPDAGHFRFDRLVLTSFRPIVPGKYIHLIGVPAGGSTSAQYSAGVEFGCDTSGLPALTPKVTASSGQVIELSERCHYQLVVNRPGSYDVTIEFSDAEGKVLHTDYLRADVPPIPGLTG
jgi:hypothetical protein